MERIATVECSPREENYQQLEQGNILFFPKTPFEFSNEDRDILRNTGLSGSGYHKNIAYRPSADKVTGFDPSLVTDPAKLRE
ncbi:MAG TPA: Kdo hydroxylase family protein, partial [Bryobacteraceae bacterium]|nr:Kdo hydroxylase family protein [Bryobacteraceae bacterium]